MGSNPIHTSNFVGVAMTAEDINNIVQIIMYLVASFFMLRLGYSIWKEQKEAEEKRKPPRLRKKKYK